MVPSIFPGYRSDSAAFRMNYLRSVLNPCVCAYYMHTVQEDGYVCTRIITMHHKGRQIWDFEHQNCFCPLTVSEIQLDFSKCNVNSCESVTVSIWMFEQRSPTSYRGTSDQLSYCSFGIPLWLLICRLALLRLCSVLICEKFLGIFWGHLMRMILECQKLP